jgi:hypothetical protein
VVDLGRLRGGVRGRVRRPENPIGRLRSAVGLVFAVAGFGVFLVRFPQTVTLANWLGFLYLLGFGLAAIVSLAFRYRRAYRVHQRHKHRGRRTRPVSRRHRRVAVSAVRHRPGHLPDRGLCDQAAGSSRLRS